MRSAEAGTAQGVRTAAVCSSIVSIGLGAVYWMARIGFANPVAPVLAAVGLALLLINLPVLVWSLIQLRQDSRSWTHSYPLVWIAVFAGVAFVGRAMEPLAASPSPLLFPLGAIALVTVAAPWIKGLSLRAGILLVAGSVVFSTWCAGVVWGRIYKSPLFMEMLIGTGIVHHDGITLAALGNMLRTYHVASMGLDGVSYMAYHWGTPWLFAQLSNLTGESVLQFYQLGFPVTMIPLFFGSVVAFAGVIRGNGDPTRDWRFWVVYLAATVGVIPIMGTDALGVWTSNLMISESYAVAIPVALMLLAVVMLFWRERGAEILAGRRTALDYGFLLVILPAGLVALGYIKISLMVLGFGAAAYAALRVGAWRRWPLVVAAIWTSLIVAVTYGRVSLAAHREGVVPLDFLRGFVPIVWWPFFFLVHLFWSTVYITLRLRREGARTLGDVVSLARAGRILDVEIVAVVAIAGVLPGLILHIDGGSAFYFSDVQRWLSVGLVLASLHVLVANVKRVDWRRLSTIAIAFAVLPLVVSTARNSVYWTVRMLKANAELRYELYPPGARGGLSPGIRWLPQLADSVLLDAGLHRAENYGPVTGLLDLSRLPISEKRVSAVFVPQADSRYWNILKRPGACGFSGFLVPSLTGISMIDGMPAAGCPLSPYYGLSLFEHRTRPQTARDVAPGTLCRRAAEKGFERVIVLHFDEEGKMSRRSLECGRAG